MQLFKKFIPTILSIFHIGVVNKSCVPRNLADGTVCVCNSKCDIVEPIEVVASNNFFHIETTQSKYHLKKHLKDTNSSKITNDSIKYMNIDPTKTGQTILGWGGTFTDAVGINIRSVSNATQKNLLTSYFSEEGIQLSLCRVTLGDSDFSQNHYSYDSTVGDTELTNFSLASEDYEYKIPFIKEALNLAHNLKLFASSRAAPSWMTDSRSRIQDKYFATWANYHKKFLDAYSNEGIPFWGLSTGYEPVAGLFEDVNPNHLKWNPRILNQWVTENLGPTLQKAYPNLTLITFDDQRSKMLWTLRGLLDGDFSKYVKGLALHSISNDIFFMNTMQTTKEKYFYLSSDYEADLTKDKLKIGSYSRALNYASQIIEDLNNGIVGHVDFNLALDTNGGPTNNKKSGIAPIIVNASADEFYKQPLFYIIGHFSKYIQPGSVRLESKTNSNYAEVSAFRRPDNGTVVVILNRAKTGINLNLTIGGKPKLTVYVKKNSMNTIIYW